MDNCACAWDRSGDWELVHGIAGLWRRGFAQTAWCRAHMEAEIAKQGQAAGADVPKDSESPTPSPFANVDERPGIQ